MVIGSRVSVKCGKLNPNRRGSSFRRICERIFGNMTSSVGDNRYAIKFDDGTTKEVHSNSLQIEDEISGLPVSESSTTANELAVEYSSA